MGTNPELRLFETIARAESLMGVVHNALSDGGVVTNINGCRAGDVSVMPSKDAFCALYENKSTQLSAAALAHVKQVVIDAEPTHLAATSDCSANGTCAGSAITHSITFSLEDVSKCITCRDGGPLASPQLTAVLIAAGEVGL